MRIFSCLNKIIEIKASSELIDLVTFFVDDIKIIVVGKGIKIKCVCRVIWGIWIIKLIRCDLIEILRIWVTTFLIVTHIVHVIIGIWVVVISLTWILELFYLERLFNQNIFHIIREVIYFIFSIILILFRFWLSLNL